MRWRLARGLLLLMLVMGSSQVGWAQPVNPLVNEELYQRNQREAEERRNREQSKDIFLQEKKAGNKDLSLPTEVLSFPIRTLVLEGEQTPKFSWAQEMLNEYSGKDIGLEGLQLIAKRINNACIARGYVTTKISIPEQDLSTGIVRLTVIPGVIREIRCNSLGKSKYWYTALPIQPGDILNLRELEQGLEQLKRVPSQDVSIKILPGEKVGESDLEVMILREKSWRLGFTVDDTGSQATGKLQTGASLSVDQLLGMNDVLYFSLSADGERQGAIRGTQGRSVYYSIPYGYWTVSLSNSHYQYHQRVEGDYSSFAYSGESDNVELSLQRIIHRDQVSKTGLQWRIIKYYSRNFIEDMESPILRKNRTASEVALFHRHNYGRSIVDIQLAQRWGVPWFHAQPEVTNPLGDGPTARYHLWLLDASINTPVQIGTLAGRYSCNIKVQYTKDRLYALDFFSIGNRYTVRGFDGSQMLAAEQGWFIRNELNLPIGKRQEGYIGFDYGQVRGPSAHYLPGTKLAGAVLGMRGSQQGFGYDVFTSWPIHKPGKDRSDTPVFGFQLTYQY